MSEKIQRSWFTRLEHLTQRVERQFTTQFHRIPQRIRFLILTSILSVLTAFLVSNYPISIMPQYRVGDVARHDLVAPAELIVDDVQGDESLRQIKRKPVLLRAGETVTAEKLPLIERVRQYQLSQRQPQRMIGLLALMVIIFFALYKSCASSQSSRLGPRTAFWVAASALMFQTFLVRVGMFGAAVLSTAARDQRPGRIFRASVRDPIRRLRSGALSADRIAGRPYHFFDERAACRIHLAARSGFLGIRARRVGGGHLQRTTLPHAQRRDGGAHGGRRDQRVDGYRGVLITNNDWSWKLVLGGIALGTIGAALTAASRKPLYTDLRISLRYSDRFEIAGTIERRQPAPARTGDQNAGHQLSFVYGRSAGRRGGQGYRRERLAGAHRMPVPRHRQTGRAEHVYRESEGRTEPAR